MGRPAHLTGAGWALIVALLASSSACTSLSDYVHNGFKVGPNYCPPEAAVAQNWIDAANTRISTEPADLAQWWTVFQDPTLNRLTATAVAQNLSVREAGLRVLQARAQLGIAIGGLFPQQQMATGSYRRQATSSSGSSGSRFGPDRFTSQWAYGFNLAWELDFWGRLRRAIDAQEALLEASAADYDAVLVTLLGDVAASYVQIRTDQERLKFLRENVDLQTTLLEFTKARLENGRANQLDVEQVESTLRQTTAGIPAVEIDLRQANNRLCVLLGIPPEDLKTHLGAGPIPAAPERIAVGIPIDIVRRRPDVRRAEWEAMAQAEQIGIAEADLYPAFTVNGSLGYQARQFSDLFSSAAFNGSFGPSFQWNLLNYGRIRNNVCLQEARFQELVVVYQQTVLLANQEAEDGLVTFLKSHDVAKQLELSVEAGRRAVEIISRQQEIGAVDYNRVVDLARTLVTQEDQWAQARGQIALGLIEVYRALGGGWETGLAPPVVAPAAPVPASTGAPEVLPAPDAEPVPPAAPEEPPMPEDVGEKGSGAKKAD